MSDQRMDQQKLVMYLMGAVVVLLVAIIGILVVQNRQATPVVDTSAAAQTATTSSTTAQTTTATAAAFDPKTATKVASGVTPKKHVEEYFQAIIDGKYEVAFNLLPTDKKAGTDASAFGQQLKSYGMSAYKITDDKASGDEEVVDASVTTSGGTFGYTWTFVKQGSGWLVKSRVLSGMGQ